MYRIGIDVGSAYTKYCVLSDDSIVQLFMEKTPVRQKEYFEFIIHEFEIKYPDCIITSCGYGKKNASDSRNINELTALARGCFHEIQRDGIILDVGGQDTKVIFQVQGKLKEFFINEKCAAGSGMFLTNTLDMIGLNFSNLNLTDIQKLPAVLSSTCAVFAQSEIVELVADNRTEQEIMQLVVSQIFRKAKSILSKVAEGNVYLSGGLSQIPGVAKLAASVLDRNCEVIENGAYMAAIGCAISE